MINYCINNVPFYKNKLNEVGITFGNQIKTLLYISKLSFTTRDDIKKNYLKGFYLF